MQKLKFKDFIIFLIIGLTLFLFTNCSTTFNYTMELPKSPIFIAFKVMYPSQVAFNIGVILPLKIEYQSKSYNIYPLVIDISLSSSYQYVIDPYISFILNIDNQIYFPKLPEEIRNLEISNLLFEKQKKILIVKPEPQTIRLIYFLTNNIEDKKLKIICNIDGNVYIYDL